MVLGGLLAWRGRRQACVERQHWVAGHVCTRVQASHAVDSAASQPALQQESQRVCEAGGRRGGRGGRGAAQTSSVEGAGGARDDEAGVLDPP